MFIGSENNEGNQIKSITKRIMDTSLPLLKAFKAKLFASDQSSQNRSTSFKSSVPDSLKNLTLLVM
jgi:hypothetical protein